MFARKAIRKMSALLCACACAFWGVSLAYGVSADIMQQANTAQNTDILQEVDIVQEADVLQEADASQEADTTQATDIADITQEADTAQDADVSQDVSTGTDAIQDTDSAPETVVPAERNAVSTYSSSIEDGVIGEAAYLEDATGIAGTSTIKEGQLSYTVDQPSYTVEFVSYSFSFSKMLEYQMTNSYFSADQEDTVSYYLNPSNFPEGSYGFYQFLDLRTSETSLTAAELNAYINSDVRGASGSLAGTGQYFLEAAQEYGINEVYLLAHAIHETGWGTSTLSQGFYYAGGTINGTYYPAGTYYNFFGIGAYDYNALTTGQVKAITEGWNSPEAAIKGAAKWISENYIYYSGSSYLAQYTVYDMRWAPAYSALYGTRCWHQYATSAIWAERIAYFMDQCYTYISTSPSSATYLVPSYQ